MADFRSIQRVRLYDGTNDLGLAAANPFFISITDGTETALIDASGNLQVGGTVTVIDGGSSITVDGTVAATQSGAWNIGTVTTLTSITNDVNIADGGNSITIDASQLDIDDLVESSDSVRIYANTAKDGSGTAYVPLVDADGKLIISNPGGTAYTEDVATPAAIVGNAVMIERDDVLAALTPVEGDWVSLRSNARGALWVELDLTSDVTIADGGNSITVDAVNLDIRALDNTDVVTVEQSTPDSLNANANLQISDTDVSQTNPVPVQIVTTAVSASEVHDYDQADAIAKDGSANHDYTVTNATFLLKSVIVGASGAGKYEVRVGPVAALVPKAVVFTSGSKLSEQVIFDPPIEVPVASTGTVRVIKRNDDNTTMDMYSTIIGNDV